MALGVSRTSNTRSNDTKAVMMSTRVRKRRERDVDPHGVKTERDKRAGRDAAIDDLMATPPVDEGGADGTDQRERSDEDSGVHRRLHTDVADPTGAVAEVDSLAAMPAEQLDQEGAGDVETLGHRVVHRRIEVHPLTGDVAQTGTHAAGGDHEDRQNRNGQQGELPLEQQHRDERAAERDGVADHRAERAGEGPLGTDDVIVQPADECAGLGAGEEGDRHPLDVVEQLHPKVVDQALTDPLDR